MQRRFFFFFLGACPCFLSLSKQFSFQTFNFEGYRIAVGAQRFHCILRLHPEFVLRLHSTSLTFETFSFLSLIKFRSAWRLLLNRLTSRALDLSGAVYLSIHYERASRQIRAVGSPLAELLKRSASALSTLTKYQPEDASEGKTLAAGQDLLIKPADKQRLG